MDRRLTAPAGADRTSRGRRRLAGAAVVVAVVLMHGAVTRELAVRMSELDPAHAMPQRIAVSFTRTIEPTAPTPVAAAAAPPRAAPVAPRAPRRVARVASATEVVASAPESAAVAAARAASEAAAQSDAVAQAMPVPHVDPTTTATSPARPPEAASSPTLASAGSSAQGSAPPFEWPASTRVSYVLTGNYRGEVSGQAQVEWIRLDDRYQVNLDLLVGPEFAPLITRRMTSEGSIAASGLVPARYDEDTQVVFRERRRISVGFEPDAVVLADGQRRERLEGVQDTASQFIQLTYLFSTRPELLRVGSTIAFPLALPRTMDRWTYDVVEEQSLVTPFGRLQAFHLKPRPRGQRKANELSAEMWIAPDLRYLPVRIRIEQDAATFIDLMISTKPEMAAPPAVASAASSGKTP